LFKVISWVNTIRSPRLLRCSLGATLLATALLAGCRRQGPAVEREGPDSLALTSPDLRDERFPGAFTCDGANTSPALRWNAPPAGTKSLALILNDRSAPPIGSFVHWVLYDLPPEAISLPASLPTSDQLPDGARQGRNDFDKIGYGGPCPPGHSEHHYVFMLFALDAKLNLPAGATRAQVDDAMKGHVLSRGVFTAVFKH
jgi:Raf kinase inhibitor-like YbhB/YbcL family protein